MKINLHEIERFVSERSIDGTGRYSMSTVGKETLYSSCFAVMTLHYLCKLKGVGEATLYNWRKYIQSFQDEQTGYFIGPELLYGSLKSDSHDQEHLRMHLCAHVLPALSLLGARPKYPLYFAHKFTDGEYLLKWLEKRNWKLAWIEGNNLLFVGQFLTYLYEYERMVSAKDALDIFFDWLDREQDSKTGMWGTNGYCSAYAAMYGAYHQYLVYYYWNRIIKYRERIVDTVLSLQHYDGGFAEYRGGGTCEDIDAIDILVNMYKQIDYRRKDIRTALRRCHNLICQKQMPDGGFVYTLNGSFIHMGMEFTETPEKHSNMFSTWFYTHAIMLISEILGEEVAANDYETQFNTDCSMGWHRGGGKISDKTVKKTYESIWDYLFIWIRYFIVRLYVVLKGEKL